MLYDGCFANRTLDLFRLKSVDFNLYPGILKAPYKILMTLDYGGIIQVVGVCGKVIYAFQLNLTPHGCTDILKAGFANFLDVHPFRRGAQLPLGYSD